MSPTTATASVCVYVCVFLYLHLSEDQRESFPNGVISFLGSEDILAGPHYVARLFEGSDLVLRLELSLG